MNVLNRRRFLTMAGITGGGLIVGVSLTNCTIAKPLPFKQRQDAFAPDAFLQITTTSEIHFYLPSSEMGQGVYSGLTTLLAEELKVAPESIQVHHAGVHSKYRNAEVGIQGTGGSSSIKGHFLSIRQAGANAREAIRQAASQQLNAPLAEIRLHQGKVYWKGQSLLYGNFVKTAGTLPVPDSAPLTPDTEFTYIGKPRVRNDALEKVTGSAVFGIDVDIPNLHYAVMLRSPVHGGTVKHFNPNQVSQLPGIKTVIPILNGVAVVATSYWQAQQAAKQLDVEWALPAKAESASSVQIKADFKHVLIKEPGIQVEESGEGKRALSRAEKIIEAEYWAPYLAHATMEPQNCTVRLTSTHCEVWAPTQIPEVAQGIAALHAGLSQEQVSIHTTFMGGGFGRRAQSDFIAEAVSIAKATGLPIQAVWSREDDTRHDWYRPASLVRLQAGLDKTGNIDCWYAKRIGPNVLPYVLDENIDGLLQGKLPETWADWLSKRGYGLFNNHISEPFSTEGLWEDYDIPHKDINHATYDPGIRTGFWRSVGHSFNAFFKESFIDELAHTTQKDPVAYRLHHAKGNPRLSKVIEQVADKAGWNQPLAEGHFHGIAAHKSFDTYVAQIAEVSIHSNTPRVHKVTCVVDCGVVVTPDIVKAQMESGIIYGLTAALHGEITFHKGAAEQTNFHDYPMMRMSEAPAIEVHIIDSKEQPTGVGEPGLPPVAAAVANAIYAANGRRLRSLPLRL
ncbi:xanthine dehydrogenase family protein molybdopterin-binding subunit [Maricurvus nonylphenolicus]|uniref:xanthine dehydrogenase family protein molybdopterin-binding subunit n=1 Tax=Maricurvus nonylphenolicus TaxID=1008307 RepID=UPI0036F28CD2